MILEFPSNCKKTCKLGGTVGQTRDVVHNNKTIPVAFFPKTTFKIYIIVFVRMGIVFFLSLIFKAFVVRARFCFEVFKQIIKLIFISWIVKINLAVETRLNLGFSFFIQLNARYPFCLNNIPQKIYLQLASEQNLFFRFSPQQECFH